MAKRCSGCHQLFDASQTMIVTPAGKFHSQACMIDYAARPENQIKLIAQGCALAELEERRRFQARKAALRPRTWYVSQAQKIFNEYIRLRDAEKPCISCGRLTGAKMNAGHYRNVADHPQLRFNEYNVHLQCEHCNRYKRGNIENYRKALLLKIGPKAVEWLESNQPLMELSVRDLESLIAVYKLKVRVLKAKQK